MATLRNRSAIVGIGETVYSRDSGRSEAALTLEAIKRALDDCGLAPHDVDGLLRWSVDATSELEVAANLGMKELKLYGDVGGGGTAGGALVTHAAAAIASGQAEVVVVYRGVNGRSGRRYGRGEVLGRGGQGPSQFTEPFGVLVPAHSNALKARRRMHETGTTSAHLGGISVSFRWHANQNPRAIFYDTPLTLEEHQASRYVVEPLRLFDLCLETDGGGAVVITSAERARSLKQPPAFIRAAAQAGGESGHLFADTAARSLGPRLFEVAQMTPDDVDVLQVYDAFSSLALFIIEDYGFCGRGEGGDFVAEGGIRWPNGRLPVNTAGGLLSEAYLQGMNHFIEGVRQLRGTSTAQVAGAEVSMVDTEYGAVILTREG